MLPSFFLPIAKNEDVMVGALVAILDHEASSRVETICRNGGRKDFKSLITV